MKKVRTILLLVLAMLLAGCKSADSVKSKASAKGSSTGSSRSYFWERDLRPVTPVASQSPEPKPAAEIAEQQAAAGTETAPKAKPAAEAAPKAKPAARTAQAAAKPAVQTEW